MSTTVDQRVVEMRFDNKQFESGVATSMSTLDKLKQKLNLKGASDGLKNIGAEAKKVDMSGLSNGIETVHAKFSAMQVIGTTALVNITNSAINAGKKIASALTIDPVKTGLQEYETQINAVQTILANTQKEGTTIKDVNGALDELNKYADLTIYNFTEMTRNIGTFTAAGVDLKTSVSAIQGIANLAAVSGSTSQQASTAMYQLSQALATGTVKLMDWNSVVNAGMGGQVFQDALKETSKELNTGAEAAIKAKGSFRESLQTGWLTSEVLTQTLKKFTTSGANEYVAKYTGLSKKAVESALKEAEARYGEADAIDKASEALAKKSGKNKEEIKEALQFAKTAEDAATKVKTFTQLWDVLKEAAQSGWAQTWRLIIGDFEQAKELFTPLANFLTGIINKMSDARNAVLKSALGKNFKKLGKDISGLLKPVNKTVKGVKTAVDTVKDYEEVVNKIINGDFGNGESRWKKLTETGYDWAHAQNLVNEKLGDSTRHATKYKEAQEKVTESSKKSSEASNELSKSEAKRLEQLAEMSDAELKSLGYTEKQIKSIRELKAQADKLGFSISEFVSHIDEIDGRWLIIDSFKNAGKGLVTIFKAIGDAWKEAFHGDATDKEITKKKAAGLYNIIAALHKFSTHLKVSDETADKLKRTFKGLFAILQLISSITGGALKIGFNILTTILGAFDLSILDATAAVGDILVKFRDWIKEHNLLAKAVNFVAPLIVKMVKAIKEWFVSLKDTETVKRLSSYLTSAKKATKEWFGSLKNTASIDSFVSVLKSAASSVKDWFVGLKDTKAVSILISAFKNSSAAIKEWIDGLKDADNIPKYIIEGLVNGIKSGVKNVIDVVVEFGKTILENLRNVLGIHSPSTETYEDGKNLILGFLNGIKDFASMLFKLVMTVGTKCIEIIRNLDLGSIITTVISTGFAVGFVKISKAFEALTGPLDGVEDVLKSSAKVVKNFGKVLGAFSTGIKAWALKQIAISLAILAGSIVVLTLLPTGKVWASIGAIAALGAILAGVIAIMGKFGPEESINFGKISGLLLSMSTAILIFGISLKVIEKVNPDTAIGVIFGLLVLLSTLTVVSNYSENIDEIGVALKKISVAMLILSIVAKIIAGMEWSEMGKAAVGLGGLIAFLALMMLITKIGNTKKVGIMLMQVAGAMAILSIVAKIIAGMEWSEMGKAAVGLVGLTSIIASLIYITNFVGKNADGIDKIGKTILNVAIAIGILAGVAVLLGMVDIGDLRKGIAAVAALGLIMAGLIFVTQYAENCMSNLIVLTVAIAVMTTAIGALSMIDGSKLAGAVIALSVVMGVFSLLIKSTEQAGKVISSLIVITVAIGLIGGILYLLGTLPVENTIGSAMALTILIGVMTIVVTLFSKIVVDIKNALIGIVALTAMAIPLLAFVGILALMNNVQNATNNAIALSELATVLTVLLIPLCAVGVLMASSGGVCALGIVALTAMAIPLLAFVGILALMQNIQNATTNVTLLINLMSVMTGLLVVLSIVGPLALIGVGSMTALTALMVAIGLLAIGIGALMEKFPVLEDFLNKGIPILEKLAYAVGSFIGNLVAGFSNAVASSLPNLGLALGMFMTNAMPFISGAKMVDGAVLKGIGVLTGAVLALTAADVIEGIASFLQGGSSFSSLGTELSMFMTNAMPFISGAKLLSEGTAQAVKALAETILILTAADVIDGLTSWFTGGSSLADFGSELAAFGPSLKAFSDSIQGVDTETVSASAKALNIMCKSASEIPNSGGWLANVTGDNSIAKFGAELAKFGPDFKTYSDSIRGVDTETISDSAKALKIMCKAAAEIPNSGGWLTNVTGDNSIAKFGSELAKFGPDFKKYSDSIIGINVETVTASAKALKELTKAAAEIPNSGGWLANVTGDNSIAEFGKELAKFGPDFKKYSDSIAGVNSESVTASAKAIKELAKMADSLDDMDYDSIEALPKDDLVSIGKALTAFSNSLEGINTPLIGKSIGAAKNTANMIKTLNDISYSTLKSFPKESLKSTGKSLTSFSNSLKGINTPLIQKSINAAKSISSFIKNLKGINSSAVSSFNKALNSISKKSVDNFVNAFKGASSKSLAAGAKMVSNLAKGIKSNSTAPSKEFLLIINNLVKTIKSKTSTFSDIGKDIDNSMAKAITKYKTSVSSAAKTVVSGAAKGAKEKYSSFYSTGESLGKGLVKGINAKKTEVYNAGYALGKKSAKGVKDGAKVNSPSKLTIPTGEGLGEGLILGISRVSKSVYKSGNKLGKSAASSISKAISRASDIIDGGINTQPTIRPVIDLSDVESGAGAISKIFGNGQSIQLSSNIKSINSMMNKRNQNGNSELLSAIQGLRSDYASQDRAVHLTVNMDYNAGSDANEIANDIANSLRRAVRRGV